LGVLLVSKMKKLQILLLSFGWLSGVWGQQITFAKEIAPIIFKNCTPCHRKGEAAPFPLENYEQVKEKIQLIQYVIQKGIMPPWKADTSYMHFRSERVLSQKEILNINNWAKTGMLKGESIKYTAPLNKTNLGKPDLVVKLAKPVRLEGNNQDRFVTYIKAIDLGKYRYLKAIEIVPQNKKVLHHCRVDFETQNLHLAKTNADGFVETNQLEGLSIPEYAFVGDYVPGIAPYIYPDKKGYRLPQKVNIMINLHYSPVSIPETDQSEVHLYFHRDTAGMEKVVNFCVVLGNEDVMNKKLLIPANTIDCFELKSKKMISDVRVFAVQPHMHLIGKKMKIYALSESEKDTIPLCKISDWDFNWQENYYFQTPVIVPKGYRFCAEACYDNTNNNPKNPFIPPQNILFNGEMKTTNEMLEFYLQLTENP